MTRCVASWQKLWQSVAIPGIDLGNAILAGWRQIRNFYGLAVEKFHQPSAAWHSSGHYIMAAAAAGWVYIFHVGSAKVGFLPNCHCSKMRGDPQLKRCRSCLQSGPCPEQSSSPSIQAIAYHLPGLCDASIIDACGICMRHTSWPEQQAYVFCVCPVQDCLADMVISASLHLGRTSFNGTPSQLLCNGHS